MKTYYQVFTRRMDGSRRWITSFDKASGGLEAAAALCNQLKSEGHESWVKTT